MIRKVAAAFALLMGLLVLAGPVAPAHAGGPEPDDYAGCILVADVSDDESTVTVSGSGFQPNFTTDVVFDEGGDQETVLGQVTTNSAGAFGSLATPPTGPHTFDLPDVPAGTYSITADCSAGGPPGSTTVDVGDVAVPNPPGGGPLPNTGSDVEPLVVIAIVALLAGIAFMLVAKRRRRAAHAT
jgi:LPXTG-motif cell wall-anchored protein